MTYEAFLLYSAVGNIVASLNILVTQKLSEAVNSTDQARIRGGFVLKCFAAASFQVFAATIMV